MYILKFTQNTTHLTRECGCLCQSVLKMLLNWSAPLLCGVLESGDTGSAKFSALKLVQISRSADLWNILKHPVQLDVQLMP